MTRVASISASLALPGSMSPALYNLPELPRCEMIAVDWAGFVLTKTACRVNGSRVGVVGALDLTFEKNGK